MMRRRRLLLIATGAVALAAAGAASAHDQLAGAGLRAAVGTFGYDLRAQSTHVTTHSLSLVAPVVLNRQGEPVLSADRLDVEFSLRDLLPGGKRRFGLRAIDVQRPLLTLIHHADGTYNVALPGGSGPPPRPDNTPLDVRVRVRDGRIALIDRFVVRNQERRESVNGVNVDAVLAPTDPAYYRVDGVLQDGARRYPISGRARFDHERGFASQHWHADELPVGPLVNFAMATHAVHVVDGRLQSVDARIYGFIADDGTTSTHAGAVADLVDGKIFAAQLRVPIGDAHGRLYVYDDGVTTDGIVATLAGVPLHLAGGVYGLAHPQMRFLIDGRGPLQQLRTISEQSARRPLSGDVAFQLRADGPIDKPVVRGSFFSPRLAYGAYELTRAAGTVAFSGEAFQVLGVEARYGPIALRAHGVLTLGKQVDTDLLATIAGPGDALPYGGAVLPHARVHALVHLTGTAEKLAARGTVAAQAPHGTLDTTFALDPDGTGTVGPLALARADGASVYARVAFDRPNGAVDGIVSARRFALLPARAVRLPGFNGAALPPVSGTLDADLAGYLRGSNVAEAAGEVHLRRAGVAGIALGDADAHLGTTSEGVALNDVSVRGPLGELRGEGAYATANGLFALRARLRSSVERLASVLHGARGSGGIDAQLRVVARNGRGVLQIADARFAGARLQGVALQHAEATVALRNNAIDVPAARIDAAGGSVVGAGSFGNGGSVRLSASGIDASAFRGAGLPLSGGRLAAVGVVSGTQRDPRAQAVVALAGASYGGAPLAATASGAYAGGTLALDRANVAYDGAVADASGSISNLAGAAPQLDLNGHVRGADVAAFSRRLGVKLPYPDAAVDADLRVRGALSDPSIGGAARIAAGSINGLAFHDVVLPLSGDLAAVAVRGGSATVGSTTLHFDALASRGGARGSVRSDRADLADFNDYFDAAETLAGRGRLAIAFATGGSSFATSGDVALAGVRYRRLPIGDVGARWSSHGRTIAASADVGGPHGRLSARGSATVPARDPLAHLVASAIDTQATIAGLDLTTWLPALGVIAPVTGRVDGAVRVRGTAPQLAFSGNAALHDGNVGRIPIRRLELAANEDRGGTRIARARLEALNLVAEGSGSFGLRAGDPVQLALHAVSPDVGAFATRATGTLVDAAGALDTTLTISGTRGKPIVHGLLDVDNPRYERTNARHAHADLAYGNGRLNVRDASLDLIAGRLALSGSVPATLMPPFVDRRNAPITARLVASNVDLGQFAQLLPKDTKAGGIVNGDVAVAGTLRDPRLSGSAALAKATFVSPQLASELRNGTLQLALAGRTARITTLHADIGGGAVDGSGMLRAGDLRGLPGSLAFNLATQEKNVGIDMPKLFRGKLNGALSVSRSNGAPILLAGDLAISHARVPLSALMPSSSGPSNAAPLPIAFALNVAATSDDRLQGPAVDVGAKGAVQVSGTLAHPALSGDFASTDGTLSFYRTFVLQSAQVAFDPASGIIPSVEATATTHVPDPATDVLLHVHGPATGLSIDFASNPDYDRSQILGLLVGAQNLGAVAGVARTTPPASDNGNAIQNLAVGYVDQRFTQSLFEPFSASLGSALGFSTFSFNAGLTGGFSASASRQLGKNLQASFSEAEGSQGNQQALALAMNFSNAASMQLTIFNAGSSARTFGLSNPLTPTGPTNYQLQALAPTPGTSGYVFTFQRRYP